MKRSLLLGALGVLLALPATATGGTGSTPLITGGASLIAGLDLSVTVNAVRHKDGTFSGKINYVFGDLHVFAEVACANTTSVSNPAGGTIGVGVAAGPQRDNPAIWSLVFVEDYGAYDEISVTFVPAAQALANCEDPSPLAAVPVIDNGEFHVRS